MRLPRLISSGLFLYGSTYLCQTQTDQSSSSTKETLERRTTPIQHNTLKHFVSRNLDLSQEYPHRTCMRPADVMDDTSGLQRRGDLPAFSYPFTFSDVVSPRARLGQLIVNPSPYIEPLAKVVPLGSQPSANRQSQILPPTHPLPQNLLSAPTLLSQSLPHNLLPSPALSIQTPDLLSAPSPFRGPITASYFPDWSLDILKPEQIQYRKFDIIYFAFGIPNDNYGVDFTQSDSLDTLDKLVSFAHGNGTRVVLSVGGWGGSKFFSVAVKSESARETFVNNLYQLVLTHNLDGIDIDWEYPGQAQIQDNIASSTDSAALLVFFQLLRAKLGAQKIISAAVTDYTFLNAQGGRMTNVEDFGKVLDYILIMNYDVWGATSNPGPNAPFSNGCEDSSQPGANMVSSIKTWTSAGFPRQKILMGLPAYGYVNHASVTTLVHRKRSETPQTTLRFDQYIDKVNSQLKKRQIPCLDPTGLACSSPSVLTAPSSSDQTPSTNFLQTPVSSISQAVLPSDNQTTSSNAIQTPVPGVAQPVLPNSDQTPNVMPNLTQTVDPNAATTGQADMDAGQNDTSGQLRKASSGIGSGNLDAHSGNQIQFTDLFKWGIVQENPADSEGRLSGINGYQVAWDRCSSTPYAFSKARNIVITYDDAISIGIKASYALAAGIGGVGFWDMTGDHGSMLIDSARKNLARVG
ncbi:hypothetical protein MJO29_014913 [Puccinia striiformis f. sp. tritici]|uniref:hypothetical protein n=1 Tax=Puccinia striiformis f. sp. tritici TaxID=168172 RepID=UPI002007E0CC|nr:hypothetical protein Pst134EA_027981 [Puccinia striiformis f. sp. tritici]KAH9448686.1 hypothetical protein Pst134EA_027981 [Puccinia striiformis f. sp. tritici]KAI7937598.1 hypothetical protein MJO29_014913 [Puccinia striiformis f. sp. tritici]